MAVSLIATLTFCEHVLFRYVLVPDDVLHNVTIDGVVRYKPDERAVMRHPDGSTSLVTINSQGWNSTKSSYSHSRSPGVTRIAVVGDSYVHGAFVDVDKGFPELVERRLFARGANVEVLRFGMDGAPMSQYLHMLRREVAAYKPDVVVIPVIHNDFDESFRQLHTRTGSSFMKLEQRAGGQIAEIPPVPFKSGLADRLREFRTFRYLYYETNAYLHFKWLISKLYWGGDAEWDERYVSSAIDIRNIEGRDAEIELYTRYMLGQFKALAAQHGFRLLFVMDGVREAVYAQRAPAEYPVGKLNALMARLTTELDLPFVDLQQPFTTQWQLMKERLEFDFDWHWNARANEVVARTIVDALVSDPRLAIAGIPRRQAGLFFGRF